MKTPRLNRQLYSALLVLAISFSSFSFIDSTKTFAQEAPPPVWQVRTMQADQTGINQPVGLVFSSKLNAFYLLDARNWKQASPMTEFIEVTPTEVRASSARIATAVQDPVNMAFDNKVNRLLILQANQLLEVPADTNGQLDASTLTRYNISSYGLQDPQGLTIDPSSGDLFILDAADPRMVRISGGLEGGGISSINFASSGIVAPHGIAFDPSTGHLQVLSPTQQKLYELSQTGEVLASRDLSQFNLKDVQGLVFAPSGDQTDDPAQMSLYLADTGSSTTIQQKSTFPLQSTGQIVELSLQAAASLPPGTTLLPATLVHIIDTSNAAWYPSAPDPAGIDYWPLTNRLLIADSEVDEMSIYFTGKNVYLSTTSGNLTGTCSTMSFTNEPTGVAINPNNNHIFISTDDANDRVFEIGLGPDGTYCTADDTVTTTDVSGLYGVNDAEDVAYGNNTVFVAGGTAAEVYRIPLGPNGVLGGGDDGPMTHFDTAGWGFHDLEGIGFNADNGTLFIVSTQGSEHYLGETSTTGTFLRAYDLSLMGTSQNPAVKSIYIASRGIDNDSNRKENDGKVWEIRISGSSPPPTVDTPPTVVSVIRMDSDPTSASSVNFAVTFSESVTGVDPSDFTFTTSGGISGASVSTISGTSSQFTVTVNTGSGDGTIRLNVVDNDSIIDSVGNPLGGIGGGNGNFNTGESYTVSKSITFADVPSSHPFWRYIEAFYKAGITSGCSQTPKLFCPDNPVTRGEMAVFIERALGNFAPNPSPTGMFADVPYPGMEAFTPFIEQFYDDGITAGCLQNPLRYCPQNSVKRGEMAVFIERAIGHSAPTPSPTGMFADVPYPGMETFTPFIEQFYNDGITGGCLQNPLRYCPQNLVTRGEMAVFIVRAFDIPLP